LDSLSESIVLTTTDWEVLVVDNNSSDQTREVSESFCKRDSRRFRYLFESRQGKSYALNTAIRESNGEILVFTDDDVTFEVTWLQDLTAVFEKAEYAGSAGRVLPQQTVQVPRWLALEGRYNLIGALCAYYDLGVEPQDLSRAPIGANMAFRREMFNKYGNFRLDLGPSSLSRVSSEDTEFARRLLAGGERLRYVPSATVYHEIHQERIHKEFFLRWWLGLGRGSVREVDSGLSALQMIKVCIRTGLAVLQWTFSIDSKRRFYSKCQVWFGAGKLMEARLKTTRVRAEINDRAGEMSTRG
jgi:glycosyltransferase involved in cell wall biosynthesis